MFRWLRRFVRSRTNQIPESKAEIWQRRLSLFYLFLGWNAFAFAGYAFYNRDKSQKKDDNQTLADKLIQRQNLKNAKIYQIDNFTYKGERTPQYITHAEESKDKELITE